MMSSYVYVSFNSSVSVCKIISHSCLRLSLCEFVRKSIRDFFVTSFVSLLDNLLYSCVAVYITPCLENKYTSSNEIGLSRAIFKIIFFFIVSIVSSPYRHSNEKMISILYFLIFSISL